MQMTKKIQQTLVAGLLLTGTLTLGGCTGVNPYTGESQLNDTSAGIGIGALGGAAVGGLLGGERGAYIGAGIGALGGGLVGNWLDRENEELRQRLVGTGVQVYKQGNMIRLVMASDVTFKLNSADINSQFYPVLDSVGIVLKKYNKTNVVVTGYTDNTGSPQYNQVLSEKRAQSVSNYLSSQGVSQNRLFARGMGQRNPIASNATTSGRAQNRRVEITLQQMG